MRRTVTGMRLRLAVLFALLAACSSEPPPSPAEDAPGPDAAEAAPCGGTCGPGTVCELGRCVAVIGPDAAPEVGADASADAPAQDTTAEASADAAVPDAPAVACDAGLTRCGDTCVDTSSDRTNCGGCNRQCGTNPDRHFFGACVESRCVSRCDVGWGDCDGTLTNGCESTLNRVAACGGCNVNCGRMGACVAADGGFACR